MAVLQLVLSALLAGSAPDAKATEVETPRTENTYLRRIVQHMRNSDSPRTRALSTQMVDPDWETIPAEQTAARNARVLREAARAAPDDPLVQRLWARTRDSDSGCDARQPCPDRAEAFARIEPDNGAAWLPLLNRAVRAGDQRSIDDALAKMAASNRFDDHFVLGFEAWKKILAAVPPTAAEMRSAAGDSGQPMTAARLQEVFAVSNASLLPFDGSTIELTRACDPARHPAAAKTRFENCARIGRLMLQVGTSNVSQAIGKAIVHRSGLETPADAEAARVFEWQRTAMTGLYGPLEADQRGWDQYFSDLGATGSEARAQELLMARSGVSLKPAADWQSKRPE